MYTAYTIIYYIHILHMYVAYFIHIKYGKSMKRVEREHIRVSKTFLGSNPVLPPTRKSLLHLNSCFLICKL